VLAHVPTTPPFRCHQLKADRDEQFAVDVGKSLRLVFEVGNDPIPRRDDGGIDLQRVTAIRILEVVDYHGD
jgi:proteic killer suppression protein